MSAGNIDITKPSNIAPPTVKKMYFQSENLAKTMFMHMPSAKTADV